VLDIKLANNIGLNKSNVRFVMFKKSSNDKLTYIHSLEKSLHIISSVVFVLVCIAIIPSVTIFGSNMNNNWSFFGYRSFIVLTGSMTPEIGNLPGGFNVGDMIVVKFCSPEDVKIGDIITLNLGADNNGKTVYLTHRVVGILNSDNGISFITKGDNNELGDNPTPSAKLIGKKIFSIPKLGSVFQKIQQNFIIILIIVFALILIYVSYIYMVKKRKGGIENSRE